MRINKLSLNKLIPPLRLALKYCENLLSFRYAKDEIIGYRHVQISHISFFNSNQGQQSVLKAAYIFKVFRVQSCLMAAQYFDQVIYVCHEYNNFQDSGSILMISDFKIFSIMLSRQVNFGTLSVQQLFYVYYKRKTPFFFNLQFLLLLSERNLSPESCLAICRPRLVAFKPVVF